MLFLFKMNLRDGYIVVADRRLIVGIIFMFWRFVSVNFWNSNGSLDLELVIFVLLFAKLRECTGKRLEIAFILWTLNKYYGMIKHKTSVAVTRI